MDAEGWIPISLIASFHRVQALTQDVNLIIQVSTPKKLLNAFSINSYFINVKEWI